MGSVDPHVRKATAIVNGSIITDTDVDHRLALVMIAMFGRKQDNPAIVLTYDCDSNGNHMTPADFIFIDGFDY